MHALTGTFLLIVLVFYCTNESAGKVLRVIGTNSTLDILHKNVSHARLSSTTLQKLIIDTDAGGDDAAAILLALEAQKLEKKFDFDIIAITCTYGNTDVKNVAANVLKILTIAKRNDIPVYIGAHKSLMKNYEKRTWFGEDGFGDFVFDLTISAKIDQTRNASAAMVELVRANPGQVSIVALGPLTNIAIALTLDSQFSENVDRIYILGSSALENRKPGDYVDFNFHLDPHSNFIVLNGTARNKPLVFPRMVSHATGITTAWRKEVLGSMNSTAIKYLNKIERLGLKEAIWNTGDLALIASIIWPQLITDSFETNMTPVYEGIDRGAVIVDDSKPQNVQIVKKLDVPLFQQLLLEIFSKHV